MAISGIPIEAAVDAPPILIECLFRDAEGNKPRELTINSFWSRMNHPQKQRPDLTPEVSPKGTPERHLRGIF